jgi:hypothetical protein
MKRHRRFEGDEQEIDAALRREFASMKKITAPSSTVDSLYRRIGNMSARPRRQSWRSSVIPGFRMKLVFTVLLTLALSVPLTFLITRTLSGTVARRTYVVRFIYEDSSAETVHLTGDFNNWRRNSLKMDRIGESSYWTIEIELSEGIYKYSFLIDDEVWIPDPLSPLKVKDSFGNIASLIVLVDAGEGGTKL